MILINKSQKRKIQDVDTKYLMLIIQLKKNNRIIIKNNLSEVSDLVKINISDFVKEADSDLKISKDLVTRYELLQLLLIMSMQII